MVYWAMDMTNAKQKAKIRDVVGIDADIIVIGGGASGLMAAITAAELGMNVLLLEQQEKTGRKLSATGNGRCNFTNADMKIEYYFQSTGKDFAAYALHTFPPEKTIAFFEESGIAVIQKNGYYYPLSGQAEFVREALLFRFLHSNSLIHKCKCSCRVAGLKKEKKLFSVYLENGYQYTASHVILACGSTAAPQLGGSEAGAMLVRQMGHTIIPMLPALCGLKTPYDRWDIASGVRVMAGISMYSGKNLLGREFGELQVTAYGISGIPVFQLSGRVVRLLEKRQTIMAQIDFLPEASVAGDDFIYHFLKKQKERYPEKSILSVLSGILPEKLARLILWAVFGKQKKNRQETVQIQKIENGKLQELIQKIHQFEIPIHGFTGFEHAQVASGGVSTKEIVPETMESRLVPGLYFAGEMIDIDGICGGYNLQWAWASGHLAGSSAAADIIG